ncbi:MAG: hypothetical protein M3044_10540 [Thermoproteota archaeon]|nr:hypothetical protein [Thermoproteota archaeon]
MANSKEDDGFGGKYPKDLFRKAVVTVSNDENNNIISQNLIGYVAKDTEDLIVVFSEFDGNLRFDIPKSIISVSGNLVVIDSRVTLSKYKFKRDDPLPQGKNLRPSAEEIIGTQTRVIEAERREVEINEQQPEPIITRKQFKTPVQAPIPSQGAQPSNNQTSAPRVKNVDMTSSIQEKEEHTTGETRNLSTENTTPRLQVETTLENENKTNAESEPLSQDKAAETLVEPQSEPLSQDKAAETLVEPQSEPLSQDKAAEEGKQSLPTAPTWKIEKEVVTVTNLDHDIATEPLETTGLDSKKEQQQKLAVPETGASKEASIDNFEIPSGVDYLYPFTVSMALLQDFTLAGIQMYNEFARELSKINGYWLNIFWKPWGKGSESNKKGENE